MPEATTADPNTVTDASASEGASSSPATGDTDGDLIMGKYKGVDDLTSAFKEMQARATKAEQKNAEAQKNDAIVKTMSQISDTLNRSSEPTDEQKRAQSDAFRKNLVTRLEEGNESDIVDMMFEITGGLETDTTSARSKALKQAMDRIDKLEGLFGDVQMSASDEYKTYEPQITALMESGAVTTKAKALEIAKTLGTVDPTPTAPLGTGGTGRKAMGGTIAVTAEEEAELRKLMPDGTTEEEIKQALKEYAEDKKGAR